MRNRYLNTYTIHRAAVNGNEEIVDILIRFGYNLEIKENGHALLYTIIFNSRKGATERLVRTKIAIDRRNPAGLNAPLHLAAQRLLYPGMKSLLKAGTNVDVRNRNQATPLYIATQRGDSLGVKLLLEHKATISFRDKDSSSALQIAATKGFHNIVYILLDNGAKIDDYNVFRDIFENIQTGETALLSTVRLNKLAVMRTLLYRGANINL